MLFIATRLFNIAWYYFIGYRVGDADGSAKLLYLARYVRTKLRDRRRRFVPAAVVARHYAGGE